MQCYFYFFCSEADGSKQFALFLVIIAFAPTLNCVFGTFESI